MGKKIARVFPTKTSMTPTDSLAFFGPPTLEAMAAEPDEVHISVTFSWDLEKADELYYQWEMLGVPVEVGGPAFGDRMSETFTPGMYLKEGMTITSRGCPKDCWFCDVGKCARGRVLELPVQDGWNVLDDNILATSDTHFAKVISMLKRQKRRPVFSGGLEPEYMTPWKAEQLMSVKPQTMYTAYDTMDDYGHLREMANMLHDAGLNWKSHQVKCYMLCGYQEDSMDAAEKRAKQIMELGFLPFAMLYRDETGRRDPEWRKFQREWANAVIVGRKYADFWENENKR